MSNEFMDFCKYHGIKRQFTAHYTPQQNDVAERKNRTIMNMARSMMKEKHLSNEYWGDDVTCSVYILNRIPMKSVKDRVPQQAWSGKCSSISHLRIFVVQLIHMYLKRWGESQMKEVRNVFCWIQ